MNILLINIIINQVTLDTSLTVGDSLLLQNVGNPDSSVTLDNDDDHKLFFPEGNLEWVVFISAVSDNGVEVEPRGKQHLTVSVSWKSLVKRFEARLLPNPMKLEPGERCKPGCSGPGEVASVTSIKCGVSGGKLMLSHPTWTCGT